MPKYYFASRASRPLTFSGRAFAFTICSIVAGSGAGVYEATTPEEERILDEAVAARRGIKSISEEEYAGLKKKANPTQQSVNSNSQRPRVVRIPTLPEVAIEARPGVPSAGLRADGSQKPLEELPPNPKVSSLIRVARVNPPRPLVSESDRAKKAGRRP